MAPTFCRIQNGESEDEVREARLLSPRRFHPRLFNGAGGRRVPALRVTRSSASDENGDASDEWGDFACFAYATGMQPHSARELVRAFKCVPAVWLEGREKLKGTEGREAAGRPAAGMEARSDVVHWNVALPPSLARARNSTVGPPSGLGGLPTS